jgi:transcriptional regulator with XRE-family HTH domain
MKQPDLGKKIAELRKAKGLTQEELVEKCNLNVRTLQRIESGEVTPRSYTIKAIFTALDHNVYDSYEITRNKFRETRFIVFSWLEQFYRYFLDLFNLKTNTMKKISILSIMFSVVAFGLFIMTTEIKAQKENKALSQITDDNSLKKPSKNESMVFSNFTCGNCFDDNDEMIGRDVKFKINGVTVQIGLIKLNRKTREFKAGYVSGKLLQNKVELTCPKDMLGDSSIKQSADKVEQSGDKILLKGNAKLFSSDGVLFEAEEITITTY